MSRYFIEESGYYLCASLNMKCRSLQRHHQSFFYKQFIKSRLCCVARFVCTMLKCRLNCLTTTKHTNLKIDTCVLYHINPSRIEMK